MSNMLGARTCFVTHSVAVEILRSYEDANASEISNSQSCCCQRQALCWGALRVHVEMMLQIQTSYCTATRPLLHQWSSNFNTTTRILSSVSLQIQVSLPRGSRSRLCRSPRFLRPLTERRPRPQFVTWRINSCLTSRTRKLWMPKIHHEVESCRLCSCTKYKIS